MKGKTKGILITFGIVAALTCIDGITSSTPKSSNSTDTEVVEAVSVSTEEDNNFITSSEFRNFVGNNANIGTVVKFKGKVIDSNSYGDVVISVTSNNIFYVYVARKSSDVIFDGDIVTVEGSYIGPTNEGNIRFSNISIQVDE